MSNHEKTEDPTLEALFSRAQSQMEQLDDLIGAEKQNMILDTIQQFELITKYVSVLGFFSRNENIDEVVTEHLRYLLLPAFLAKLTLKIYDDRLERLRVAEIYIRDFLRRSKEYQVPGDDLIPDLVTKQNGFGEKEKHDVKDPKARIIEENNKRAAKIAALKQKQENEERIALLKKRIEDGTADEEQKRDYFLSLLSVNVIELLDEFHFVEEEKLLLEHRGKLEKGEVPVETQPPSKPWKFSKPITIVKNELQKQVFGAGYPSLPLLTVDEFYKELVEEGALPGPGSKSNIQMNYAGPTKDQLEEDSIKKELDIESDNPEYLANARAYDDWKDEHRRGFGNRMGKG